MPPEPFEEAVSAVEPVLEEHVLRHPFVQAILGGDLAVAEYAAYLVETYHLVRQTPRYLAAAAGRSADEWLQDWFLDLAVDERRHDRLCLHDLKALGVGPERVTSGTPRLGAWTMIAQNHYLATTGDPAGILGFAAATEGLGASLGPPVSRAMVQYPFARGALSFLKVHSTEDQDHIARVRAAFNRLAGSPERYELMVAAWTYTLQAYGQLFSDAVEGAGALRLAVQGGRRA